MEDKLDRTPKEFDHWKRLGWHPVDVREARMFCEFKLINEGADLDMTMKDVNTVYSRITQNIQNTANTESAQAISQVVNQAYFEYREYYDLNKAYESEYKQDDEQ